jgi:hypothetical protein
VPILVWNVQNDWVTFHHVNRLSGKGNAIRWLGPLAYLAGQCALLLVFWFAAWVGAMIAHRPWVEKDAGLRYLWWLSLPMFTVFLLFSFKTGGGELNWPVTAYLSGLVLAAGWMVRQLRSPRTWERRLTAGGLGLTCGVGLALTLFVHRSDWLRPVLMPLAGRPTEERPYPLRGLDPTCRLRGWRTLAAEVDRLRAELRARGIEPVLAGAGWALPGELGFYCTGHPTVYSVGPVQGDRHSQYDLWRPNPVADGREFRGRTFLIIGGAGPGVRAAFRRVGPDRTVVHYEVGQPVAGWTITVCHDFHGFPPPTGSGRY